MIGEEPSTSRIRLMKAIFLITQHLKQDLSQIQTICRKLVIGVLIHLTRRVLKAFVKGSIVPH